MRIFAVLLAVLVGLISESALAQLSPCSTPGKNQSQPATEAEIQACISNRSALDTMSPAQLGNVLRDLTRSAGIGGGAGGASLDMRSVGMAPDGVTDNSAIVPAWMGKISPVRPLFVGYSSAFLPILGQASTYYYFGGNGSTYGLDLSRGGRMDCGRPPPTNTSGGGVTLLVGAGLDGVVNDAATTSPDTGLGSMEIDNCLILSMGLSFAGATMTVGSDVVTGATLPAYGTVQPSWGAGDGIIPAIKSPGIPANGTSLTQSSTGVNTITASGGFPAAVQAGWFVADVTAGGAAQGFYGGNPIVSCSPNGCGNAGNTTITMTSNVTTSGASDKVFFLTPDLQIIPTGAYIDSCTSCSGSATLNIHPGFEPVWAPASQGVVLYQLPASLRYTFNASSGSPTLTILSGPRNLVEGDMLWGPGIPFGTIVKSPSGSIPSETVTLSNITMQANVNATANETGAFTWVIPACRTRRVQSTGHGVSCVGFPIGLKENCNSLNCTTSHDLENWYSNDLIGELVSGGNTGAGTCDNEEFSGNYLFDMIDAGTVGRKCSGLNSNSSEGASSLFTVAFNNAATNIALLDGGYFGQQSNQPAILPIVSATPQWGVPAYPSNFGGTILVVNPSAGFQSTIQKFGVGVLRGQSFTGVMSFSQPISTPYVRTGQSTNQDGAGEIALSSGTASWTLLNPGSSHPICKCWDITTSTNACVLTYNSTTGLTFTGTGTDTVEWQCTGRN